MSAMGVQYHLKHRDKTRSKTHVVSMTDMDISHDFGGGGLVRGGTDSSGWL